VRLQAIRKWHIFCNQKNVATEHSCPVKTLGQTGQSGLQWHLFPDYKKVVYYVTMIVSHLLHHVCCEV